MIIDPPSDFAPLPDWERFLTEMEALAVDYPDDSTVAEYLAIANDTVARLRG